MIKFFCKHGICVFFHNLFIGGKPGIIAVSGEHFEHVYERGTQAKATPYLLPTVKSFHGFREQKSPNQAIQFRIRFSPRHAPKVNV